MNASIHAYLDENVSAGRTYRYYVTAVNEVGESGESEAVVVRIPASSGWGDAEIATAIILAALVVVCAYVVYRGGKKRHRRKPDERD